MSAERNGAACLAVYFIVNGAIFLAAGIACNTWTKEASSLSTYPTGFMNQVSADWTSPWLTDLMVTSDTTCPASFPTETYGRHYYGNDLACDCLGIYSQWITGDNRMNLGERCSYNQTLYGCA